MRKSNLGCTFVQLLTGRIGITQSRVYMRLGTETSRAEKLMSAFERMSEAAQDELIRFAESSAQIVLTPATVLRLVVVGG